MFLDLPWVLDIHLNHHMWHLQCLKFLPSDVKRLHLYHGILIHLSSASRLPQTSKCLSSLHPRRPMMTPMRFSIQTFQWNLLIHGEQIPKEMLRPCHRAFNTPIQDLRITCSASHTSYNLVSKGTYAALLFQLPQQAQTPTFPLRNPCTAADTTPLVVRATLLVQAKQPSTVRTLSTQLRLTTLVPESRSNTISSQIPSRLF